MEFVAIASTLVSAAGSIQSGKAQKQMYNLQALQTTAQSERKALQYELQANEILQRKRQANAAIAARSFAGGVDAFSGSPDILRSVNDTVAGREFMFALDNANAAMSFGDIEANMLRAAGKQAEKAGYFDAAAKLGMAAATYAKMPTPAKTDYSITAGATSATMGSQGLSASSLGQEFTGAGGTGIRLR
jgi:hypothetical protein